MERNTKTSLYLSPSLSLSVFLSFPWNLRALGSRSLHIYGLSLTNLLVPVRNSMGETGTAENFFSTLYRPQLIPDSPLERLTSGISTHWWFSSSTHDLINVICLTLADVGEICEHKILSRLICGPGTFQAQVPETRMTTESSL